MFFRQVLHEDLGCASYVVASGGSAAVVDPQWEIDEYLALAAAQDSPSSTSSRPITTPTTSRVAVGSWPPPGPPPHNSADAGVDYEHEPLRDGDVIEVGSARIRAVASPGHRPEHLSYLVTDTARGDQPWLLLSGDSLFVGDIARPDLAVEPEEGARGLFATFARLEQLDDFVELWPGHIGGSLCGGAAMSEKPDSTIGFERRLNRYLKIDEEDEFVKALTSETQPQPPNFERIVELNRGPLITEAVELPALAPKRAKELVDAGVTLIDTREPREFDRTHVPGSINVTAVKAGVGTRAAWMVEPDSKVILLAAGDDEARRAARMLEAVGFRRLLGYVGGGVTAWRSEQLELATTPAIDASTLAEKLGADDVLLLDVREAEEWRAGHVRGSLHIPYHQLRDGTPDDIEGLQKPLAVTCFRSALAASILKARGIEPVVHVAEGGVADLADLGIDLVRDDSAR